MVGGRVEAGDVSAAAYLRIANYNSGKCLVAQGTANGSRAFQFDCHSEFADQWWYRP